MHQRGRYDSPWAGPRGRCSFNAQGLKVIICCARFHHDSVQDMRMGTILGQRTMEALLGTIPGSPTQVEMARNITTPPMRMGLGLRSAMRTAPGAFWDSWADPCSQNVCHVSLVKSCTSSPTLTHLGARASWRSQCPDWTAMGSSLVFVGRCCDAVSASTSFDRGGWRVAAVLFVFCLVPNTTFGRRLCLPVCCSCMGRPLQLSSA